MFNTQAMVCGCERAISDFHVRMALHILSRGFLRFTPVPSFIVMVREHIRFPGNSGD
jgi:hypothetical protein